ncbi:PAS domain S-box protein [Thiohalobacter thiocyanaticus]|uniref:histidine kinase n=2 Tax=Thiohalobacter thiocyanaticus TaxID=585455 RepID=A0A426QN11_9GAMM|nr:PAS domain S-box protein [Thiohalobacter thiocyanaticus]
MDPLALSPSVQPDGTPSAEAWAQRVAAAARLPQAFEWRFGADGRKPVRALVQLEPGGTAGPQVLQGRLQDLGDLFRAEAAWRESETRLTQILANTTAVVYVKDRDGHYLLANRRFERLFDLPAGHPVGKTDAELGLFDADTVRVLRRNDARVLEQSAAIEYEETITVAGCARTYLSIKFPLFNTEGEAYAVCGISTDITERKRTETALSNVALGVSGTSSDDVFEAIAYYLTRSLEVDFAFIGELKGDGRRLQTLAICHQGEMGENFEYDLEGTPCQAVVGRDFCFIPQGLRQRYPGDNMLHAFGFDGYAGYPLFDSAGRALGLIAVVNRGGLAQPELVESILRIFSVRAAAEIERMQIDQALRQSEASYRGIFEAAEDAVFIHDIDSGRIVDVNPRACEIYGYSHAEMLNIDPGALSAGVPPYTGAEARQWLARARAGGTQRFEWHRRNQDGSLHWDEVCLKRVTIAGVERILASTREITERKAREQALRSSENRLRATIETALDCIIGMDARGRITEFNPAAEECFGYRCDEVLGQPLAELMIPPRDREAHRSGLARYRREGCGPFLGQRVEVNAMRADGSEFPAELAITVARSETGDSFIGYLRDITRTKEAEAARAQLEAQLRQAQKMEAIGHLSGGVAHDFNNILTGIMGYVSLAEEYCEGLADPRLGQYLARARQSGERARDLIRQLLTFSRGQRGEPRPLDLGPLTRETLRLLRSVVPSSIEFGLDLDGRVPPVMLDPVQVEQMLMNLCINARDAMQGTGRIVIGLHRVILPRAVCSSCRQSLEGELVELSVTDTGPGIAPEHLERIFEPFFTTKETGAGSGMGLATIHGILHESGAHVLVETEPGLGTRFRLLFPPLTGAVGSADAYPEPGPAGAVRRRLNGHILVVDDDPAAGDFMQDLFDSWGLQVTRAGNGRAALDGFARQGGGFDVVLLDQTMPGMSGLETARCLRAAGASVPILLYTGYSADITEDSVRQAGLQGLLRKPVDIPLLYQRLNDLLAS